MRDVPVPHKVYMGIVDIDHFQPNLYDESLQRPGQTTERVDPKP